MAVTLTHELQPGAPVNLVTAFPLATDTRYILGVVGPGHVRLREGGANAPTDLTYYHSVPAGGQLGLAPDGDPIWAWAVGGPARLVATPA